MHAYARSFLSNVRLCYHDKSDIEARVEFDVMAQARLCTWTDWTDGRHGSEGSKLEFPGRSKLNGVPGLHRFHGEIMR
jgi:hypothetical protein